MSRQRLGLLSALAVIAAASRLLPHPPNFTASGAVALFVAATFPGAWPAVVASFGSLLLGDGLLELSYRGGWQDRPGFYPGQWAIYACLIPTVALGLAIRRRRTFGTVAAASLANAVVFYLASNFACFHGSRSPYPQTLAGLLECYEMAIPFFRNSLAGDAFFGTALFGGLAMAESRFPALRSRSTAVPATIPARSS